MDEAILEMNLKSNSRTPTAAEMRRLYHLMRGSLMAKIWKDEKGKLFHDECFDAAESREGYTAVTLDELDEDAECESCGGEFLMGPLDEEEEDDDDDDDDGIESP